MSTETENSPITDMLDQGMAIMRVENENLMTMAQQRPRDIEGLTRKALAELRAFPKFAKRAYYSIPYKDRSGGEEKEVLVEGPSIKAANALLRHWGNNSSGFRVVGADEERVLIQGVFVDHEAGMRRTAEISVSRKARKRDGTYYLLQPDKLNMAIQAGGSKAVRNAALNGMPNGLVDCYFEEAKSIVARGGKSYSEPAKPEDINAAQEEIFKAFEKHGVSRTEIANYVTRHPELETEEAVTAHLQGVLNAIDDGHANVAEVFSAPANEPPITEPQKAAPATGSRTPPNAQKPPTTPASGQKPAPGAGWLSMASKIDGGTCETCHEKMAKGVPIYYDPKAGRAHHKAHFA